MTIDRQTMITDLDWNETSRPIVVLSSNLKNAALYIGGAESMKGLPIFELDARDGAEMVLLLRDYAEIFEEAAKFVRESGPEAKSAPVPIVKKPYEPD